MASVKTKRIDRKRYPGVEKQIKKSIQILCDNNNYFNNLDHNVDDIFNWWISNDSIKVYKARKLQYKIIYKVL